MGNEQKSEDLPLHVTVQDGVFAITIGINTIAWAAEHSPFDEEKNDFVQKWKVVDRNLPRMSSGPC